MLIVYYFSKHPVSLKGKHVTVNCYCAGDANCVFLFNAVKYTCCLHVMTPGIYHVFLPPFINLYLLVNLLVIGQRCFNL
jgi:hypothetical protein